jgi:hypothetical protein
MLLLEDSYAKINQREGMSTTRRAHCSASQTTFINKAMLLNRNIGAQGIERRSFE